MNRRRFIVRLCVFVVLALTGCQGSNAGAAGDGVYLQKLEEDRVGGIYNPLASYRCSLLYYDSRMYTSSLTFSEDNQSALRLEDILGQELTQVSGNHGVYWSTDGGGLSEITHEGTLYRVNGYDEDFRIALCYENAMPMGDTCYYLIIFDHLNDIYVKTGSDLFDDRLHLSEAVRVEGARYGEENPCDLSGKAVVEEFLAALYDGEVLDTSADTDRMSDPSRTYMLYFYDSNDLVTELMVYESGCAAMEYNGTDILAVDMDAEACEELIDFLIDAKTTE